MARLRRVQFAGAIYHVRSRGNRKGPIFEDDVDRRELLTIVGDSAVRYGARALAYCLMGNHYHLVLETPRGNISDVMRQINAVYTQRSNRRHRRTGHLFDGRFRSTVVQRESYLRRVGRYVVRNPVRAGLVKASSAWPWSSYQATAGLDAAPEWLDLEWLRLAFRAESVPAAQEQYCLYVNDAVTRKDTVDMGGPVLGNEAFESAFRNIARLRHVDSKLPRRVDALGRPSLATLFVDIGRFDRRRDGVIAIAHLTHGYRLAEIAAFLQLNPSTASKALRRHQQKGRGS